METVRFAPREVRAVSFLAHGQKCEHWLPAGDYENKGEVWLDSRNNVRAVMLTALDRRAAGGETFYVHPAAYAAAAGRPA